MKSLINYAIVMKKDKIQNYVISYLTKVCKINIANQLLIAKLGFFEQILALFNEQNNNIVTYFTTYYCSKFVYFSLNVNGKYLHENQIEISDALLKDFLNIFSELFIGYGTNLIKSDIYVIKACQEVLKFHRREVAAYVFEKKILEKILNKISSYDSVDLVIEINCLLTQFLTNDSYIIEVLGLFSLSFSSL